MATKELSNEFMQKIVNEEAWKELSGDFNWSETLLEKFQDMVDRNERLDNRINYYKIVNQIILVGQKSRTKNHMIQKFKNRINWEKFSEYINEDSLTETILETFKNKWQWHKLSVNRDVPLTYDLLDKYADLWDWEEIIDNYRNNVFEGYAIEFYERYREHIPVAKVQKSYLWQQFVCQQKRQLIAEITA